MAVRGNLPAKTAISDLIQPLNSFSFAWTLKPFDLRIEQYNDFPEHPHYSREVPQTPNQLEYHHSTCHPKPAAEQPLPHKPPSPSTAKSPNPLNPTTSPQPRATRSASPTPPKSPSSSRSLLPTQNPALSSTSNKRRTKKSSQNQLPHPSNPARRIAYPAPPPPIPTPVRPRRTKSPMPRSRSTGRRRRRVGLHPEVPTAPQGPYFHFPPQSSLSSLTQNHTVHQKDLPLHEKILRHFDLSGQYGSCIGITRLARWKRANGLGLEPPLEVLAVLIRELEGGDATKTTQQKKKGASSRSQGCSMVAYIDELGGGRVGVVDA